MGCKNSAADKITKSTFKKLYKLSKEYPNNKRTNNLY